MRKEWWRVMRGNWRPEQCDYVVMHTGLTALSDLVSSAPSRLQWQLSPSNEAHWIDTHSLGSRRGGQADRQTALVDRMLPLWGPCSVWRRVAHLMCSGGKNMNFVSNWDETPWRTVVWTPRDALCGWRRTIKLWGRGSCFLHDCVMQTLFTNLPREKVPSPEFRKWKTEGTSQRE